MSQSLQSHPPPLWIPAYAGMTVERLPSIFIRVCGPQGAWVIRGGSGFGDESPCVARRGVGYSGLQPNDRIGDRNDGGAEVSFPGGDE